MANALGIETKASLSIQDNYRTPKAITGNCLFYMTSEDLKEKLKLEYVHRKTGFIGHMDEANTNITVDGKVELNCRYSTNNILYELALGTRSSLDTVEAGVYRMRYKPQQGMNFATFALDPGIVVFNYESLYAETLSLSATAGEPLKATLSCGAKKQVFDSPNSDSSSWTLWDTSSEVIMFEDSTFSLAEFDPSTPLSSGDDIEITSFNIDISRQLKTKSTKYSGVYNDEPVCFLYNIKGSFDIPVYGDNTIQELVQNRTSCMAKMRFVGSQISGTSSDLELVLWLPTIKLESNVPIKQEVLTQQVDFKAFRQGSLASGFPYSGTELVVETINTNDGTYI